MNDAQRKALIARLQKHTSPNPPKKNWIQGAIKHPGALRAQLGVTGDKPIPGKKLAQAAKKGGKLGQRARLAQTLKKL